MRILNLLQLEDIMMFCKEKVKVISMFRPVTD
jgi:hypothetical protein